jgi:hypothetical protein
VSYCDILSSDANRTRRLAPIDIMKFVEEDVGGPRIEKDDWYTRWSMKIVGQKHVIEVRLQDVITITSQLILDGLSEPQHLSGL